MLCFFMAGIITAIEPQKKHPDRVNIYLDGEFAFGLSNVVAVWLHSGQVLGDEKIASLQQEDEIEGAYQRALHFLSYRPRSVHEVRDRLGIAGFEPLVIDEVLLRLEKKGYIGDVQFAQQWIENRATFRPRSHRALRYELRQKGVNEEVIVDALASAPDEEGQARKAAAKYHTRLQGLDWKTFANRLGGYLGRLGFSYPVIKPVVLETWQKMHAENSTEIIGNIEE